jgi:hypothetical protein
MQRIRARLGAALWLIALLAAPLLVLYPALTGDGIPLALNGLYAHAPWEEARPVGWTPTVEPFAADHTYRLYPWHLRLHEAGEAGVIPLWNPKEGLGTPFLALWRTRVFSPFSVPLYFLPIESGLALSLFLKMAVAGCMAWYVARRFGMHRPSAFLAAIAFQWSAPVVGWLTMPIADVVVWLPLAWYALERFSLGKVALWPKAGIVFALMGLGGEPKALAAIAVLGLLYLLLRTIFDRSSAHPIWASFGYTLAWIAGGGLLAMQLLPYLEYLGQAAPGTPTAKVLTSGWDILALLSPDLLAPDRGMARAAAALLHPGLVPWILLFVWLALRNDARAALRARLDAMLIASATMGVLAACAQADLFPIPVLNRFAPEHLLAAWPMAVAFTAGGAIEEWMILNAEAMKRTLRRLLFLGPLAILTTLGGLIAGMVRGGGDWPTALYMVFALIALVAVLGKTIFKPSLALLGATAFTLTFAGLYLAHGRALPYTALDDAFPDTPFIQSLRAMETRVGGTPAMQTWPLAGNGLYQIFAPSGIALTRYQGFMERAKQDPQLLRRTGAHALLLKKEDIQGTFAPLRSVLRIEEVFPAGAILFRDLQARPRTAMIYTGRRVEHFDPALLDSDLPPLLEGATLPETDEGRETPATIIEERPGYVSVRIGETRPGVLVLADAFYPGWTAKVDGRPTPIIPVDGMFRGVEIGPGEHEVVFEFAPYALQAGAITSGITLIIVLLALRPWRNRRRRRAEKAGVEAG